MPGRRGQPLFLGRLNIQKSILGQSGKVRSDLGHSHCASVGREWLRRNHGIEAESRSPQQPGKMKVIDGSGLCEGNSAQ